MNESSDVHVHPEMPGVFYLCLGVWLQSQQTPDLLALGLNDSRAHIVLWVRINVFQKGCSQSQQLHVERM